MDVTENVDSMDVTKNVDGMDVTENVDSMDAYLNIMSSPPPSPSPTSTRVSHRYRTSLLAYSHFCWTIIMVLYYLCSLLWWVNTIPALIDNFTVAKSLVSIRTTFNWNITPLLGWYLSVI